MTDLRALLEKIPVPFTGDLACGEPMSRHTTFQVGGPADLWVRPRGEGFPEFAVALLGTARSRGVPVFILGGGANLVIADRGIRGIVLDTSGWTGWNLGEGAGGSRYIRVRSGTAVDGAAEAAAAAGLSGLEFLAGMPGSAGGAVWMNARCYERSVSDLLMETRILDESLKSRTLPFEAADFGYKKSPFQNREVLILSAQFSLKPRLPEEIYREMADHRRDREEKGHYRFPSAGSAFKNNRAFGRPAGKIIDSLGLRGFTLGGAAVAPFHGNIIINTGTATAADIRALTEELIRRVKAALGISLEPEILFAGDWE
ncbi:MAG: UDP-N-acetylmuramate dehydrogenase [Treponema sp.]|jgi:UDP-N-acetylmuramate dehydrogenase|nr:UDP-N-acetylmuramate dehydrogenase [Treponema sp.]